MALRLKNASKGENSSEEKMMQSHLLALIDTCFEEGHYESGMDLLDKARSPKVYVAPYHIRVLLYIALYPPFAVPSLTASGSNIMSPRKERQRKTLTPTPAASERAISLLRALALSDAPSKLMMGLPAHGKRYGDGDGWRFDPGVQTNGPSFIPDQGPMGEDNRISHEATSIAQAKDVWACLEEGFIKRTDGSDPDPEEEIHALKNLSKEAPSTPKRKPSTRRSRVKKEDIEDEDMMDFSSGQADLPNAIMRPGISPSAWSVLEWLIVVFEKDEQRIPETPQGGYSPLLLAQLPISAPRSDITVPLNYAFDAFTSTMHAQRRFSLGMRLVNLLVHLTIPSPPHTLSPSECVRRITLTVIKHSLDPESSLPSNFLRSFLASLAPSNARFKLAFCCLYLAYQSQGGQPSGFLGGMDEASRAVRTGRTPVKPKPMRRAAAATAPGSMPLAKQASSSSVLSSAADSTASANPYPIPPADDVLSLLVLRPKEVDDEALALRLHLNHVIAKLHVVTALSRLDVTGGTPDVGDGRGWIDAVKSGQLHQAIRTGFTIAQGELEGEQLEEAKKQYEAAQMSAELLLGQWEG